MDRAAQSSHGLEVEGDWSSLQGGDESGESDSEERASTSSREGRPAPVPSREGAQSAYPAAEDGEAAEADPLRLPDSLIPQQISVNEFRKEQLKDEFAKQLLEKLAHADVVTRAEGTAPRSGAVLRLAKFAALDGVLHRVTDASDPKEGYDSARIYVPPSLRQRLIRLKHATVFGAHRNERATHHLLGA